MELTSASRPAGLAQPVCSVLTTSAFPLFLGGMLSDVAYARTYEVQWLNFAAWLIAGAMVFAGLALAWSLLRAILGSFRQRRTLLALALLTAIFVLGLLNSFVHARDAWATMPSGLVLSLIVTVLSAAAMVTVAWPARRGAAS